MRTVVNQAWPSYTFCICLFVLYPRFELKYTDFLCLQIWKCGEKRGYHCQQPQINYRPFTRIINLRSTINLLTIDPLIGLSTLDQPIYPSLILSSLDQLSTLHWYYQPQINYRPFTGILSTLDQIPALHCDDLPYINSPPFHWYYQPQILHCDYQPQSLH